MATTQPIRDKKDLQAIADYFLAHGQIRNHALVVLGVCTALRISDLLCLRWDDVFDFGSGRVRASIEVIEKKTGKGKTVALNDAAVAALTLFADHAAREGRFLIENAQTKQAISRVQAYRILQKASDALELENRVSCHSLRKTFGYHAWKNGASPVVIMEIYNHSSLAVTRRYLGVTQDDKNEVYLGLELTA